MQTTKKIEFAIPRGIKKVKNIIAIGSGKGGVGKSTVTSLLAYALKERGWKVGILDADIYGPSQLFLMGTPDKPPVTNQEEMAKPIEKDGIKYISMAAFKQGDEAAILRAPMVVKWLQFFLSGIDWGDLDFLLLDLPPGTGDIQLTMAQQSHLSGAIIVTTANDVASEISKKGLNMFLQVSVPILGIVENMSGFVCGHCQEVTHLFVGQGAEKISRQFGVPVLGKLPMHPKLTQTVDGLREVLNDQNEKELNRTIEKMTSNLLQEFDKVLMISRAVGPTTMEINTHGQLHLQWQDETQVELNPRDLRLACRCASCINEVTGEKILSEKNVPETITLLNARPVGRYGLSLQFSDGHGTGIYRFDYLKKQSSSSQRPASPVKADQAIQAHYDQGDLRQNLDHFLQTHVAPSLASHGGKITITKIEGSVLYVHLGGGCQGCSQVDATLKQGIEKLVKKQFPEITEIRDETNHEQGSNPYFQ
jgi:ATP-binding protein involved in chromosome partitioning